MGRNNRQRRAAKARRRSRDRGAPSARRDPNARSSGNPRAGNPFFTARELAEGLLDLAASPRRSVHDELTVDAIERLCTLDRAVVTEESERYALRLTDAVWNGGWQPAELARQIHRATSAATARLALVVIAADHARRRAATVDPRWIDQLGLLALPPVETAGWLRRWAEEELAQWHDVVRTVVAYLRCLTALSRIPILIPPPGARAAPGAPIDLASTTNDPMLERVRRAARAGRVDHVRSGGRGVHGQGATAHDPARRRRRDRVGAC